MPRGNVKRAARPGKSLADVMPNVAAQWHPTKNGDLKPHQAFPGSNKPIWWKCDFGHVWRVSTASRAHTSSGCPICVTGPRAPKPGRSLAERCPASIDVWHPSKNAPLTPWDVSCMSNKIVFWKCHRGHTWSTQAKSTARRDPLCPTCPQAPRNHPASPPTGHSVGQGDPEILALWHPSKNGNQDPQIVPCASKVPVWWICRNGHESYSPPRYKSKGCAKCFSIISKESSSTEVDPEEMLSVVAPLVAAQWHPTKNGSRTPSNTHAGARTPAWFQCENGHEWEARLRDRVGRKTGCQQCIRAPKP